MGGNESIVVVDRCATFSIILNKCKKNYFVIARDTSNQVLCHHLKNQIPITTHQNQATLSI